MELYILCWLVMFYFFFVLKSVFWFLVVLFSYMFFFGMWGFFEIDFYNLCNKYGFVCDVLLLNLIGFFMIF